MTAADVHARFTTHTASLLIALILLAAAPFVQTLRHEFVDYDDTQYLTENPITQQGLTASNIAWAFTTLEASNWHPLTWLSHMLDVQVFGMWAGGHHLTNVLFHAANTALLFWVLFLMTSATGGTGGMWRSALVAALFAIHPLHVESVAWVSERKDVLSTFFGLLAMLAYVKYIRTPSLSRYALIIAFFALSLLAKPMLVTLPFVLLLLDIWPLKRWTRWNDTKIIFEKLPLLAISIGSSVMTVIAQRGGAMYSLEMLPLDMRIFNAAVSYASYLFLTFWPFNLAVIYPLPDHWPLWRIIISLGVLIIITAVAIARRRTTPALLIGWLIFLGTLVPVIGLVQVGVQSMADRYMYVPMIGLLIMLAWAIPPLERHSISAKRAIIAGALLIIASLTVITSVQTSQWKNSTTLFTHAVSVTEGNFIAHNILGVALRKQGLYEQAIPHLETAIQLKSDYVPAHYNMGLLRLATREFDAAEHHFRESLRMTERDGTNWTNLGIALHEQGRHAEAIEQHRHAISINPDLASAHVNLGTSLLAINAPQEALAAFSRAAQLQPNLIQAHIGIGASHWRMEHAAEAATAFAAALALNPNLIQTRIDYGVALAAQGQMPQAIAQFERVLSAQPDNAVARRYLEMAKQGSQQPSP